MLRKMQQDCDRNADILKRRWESRNAPWLINYGEGFKKKYEDKNPFIKQEGPQQSYAQIVANNNDGNHPTRTKQISSTSTKTSSKSNSAVTTKPMAAGTPEKMPAKQPPRRIPPNTSGTASNNIPSLSSGNNLTNQYRNDNQPPNGGPREAIKIADQKHRLMQAFLQQTICLINKSVLAGTVVGSIFGTRSETSMEPVTEKDQTGNDIKIIKLSKRKFSDNEKNVLNKGLKFTPVPPSCDLNELKNDIYKFTRQLGHAEYFEGMENKDISLRLNRSDFVPPINRNTNLEKYIQTVEDFPLEPQKKTKTNLSKMETEAIKTLANDTSIVNKEADKGVATIIMDQSHYKNMVENTLNDKNFYEKLDSDLSKAEKN